MLFELDYIVKSICEKIGKNEKEIMKTIKLSNLKIEEYCMFLYLEKQKYSTFVSYKNEEDLLEDLIKTGYDSFLYDIYCVPIINGKVLDYNFDEIKVNLIG